MCRQNELWAWAAIAFGLGVLLSVWIESGFIRCCIGFAAVALGIMVMQKK